MRVTVQHSGTEIPTCEGNKFAQTRRTAWLAGGEWPSWMRFVFCGRSMPPSLTDCMYCLSWPVAAQLWAFGKFSGCCWNSIVLNVHKTPCWVVSLRPSASVFLSYNICGWFVNGVEFEILLVLIVFHCMLCAIACTMHNAHPLLRQ